MIADKVILPPTLKPGKYVLGWRNDCEVRLILLCPLDYQKLLLRRRLVVEAGELNCVPN